MEKKFGKCIYDYVIYYPNKFFGTKLILSSLKPFLLPPQPFGKPRFHPRPPTHPPGYYEYGYM